MIYIIKIKYEKYYSPNIIIILYNNILIILFYSSELGKKQKKTIF